MARSIDFMREGRGGGVGGEEGHSRLTGQGKEAGDGGAGVVEGESRRRQKKIEAEMKN